MAGDELFIPKLKYNILIVSTDFLLGKVLYLETECDGLFGSENIGSRPGSGWREQFQGNSNFPCLENRKDLGRRVEGISQKGEGGSCQSSVGAHSLPAARADSAHRVPIPRSVMPTGWAEAGSRESTYTMEVSNATNQNSCFRVSCETCPTTQLLTKL